MLSRRMDMNTTSFTSCAHWKLIPFKTTAYLLSQDVGRGAIEMTIVRLCVRPSVRPSFRATGILSPQLLMSFIGLILNFVDYVMKMCMTVFFQTFF